MKVKPMGENGKVVIYEAEQGMTPPEIQKAIQDFESSNSEIEDAVIVNARDSIKMNMEVIDNKEENNMANESVTLTKENVEKILQDMDFDFQSNKHELDKLYKKAKKKGKDKNGFVHMIQKHWKIGLLVAGAAAVAYFWWRNSDSSDGGELAKGLLEYSFL